MVPRRLGITSLPAANVIRLVARGEFAPEYSVDFQESVGDTLSVPVALDPGSWILRITLNGIRQGDTLGAHYDIAVAVTP
jgi:hypothetical protein